MRISLIGLGTVGQGVVELLRRHHALHRQRTGRDCRIVSILVRDPSRSRDHIPENALITSDPDRFFAIESDLLIEVAGGVHPAREHIERALETGRDVVTANKALLAAHAPDLFRLAERHRRRLLFEAAVAGGVPIIKLVSDSLASSRIDLFAGILNGTCNFILTQMSRAQPYADALRQAQQQGFAEADPTLDVSGTDSLQKLCLLASLAFSRPIVHETEMPIESSGITNFTADHLAHAERAGGTIKLIAYARRRGDDAIELYNGPMFVPHDSPLARIHHSDMGIWLRTDALKSMFLMGDGAGRFPTASAVVADVLEAARFLDARAARPLNTYPSSFESPRIVPASLPRSAGFPRLPTES
ncbi:MAG: homoserine dehydrogenase [Phycisphaerae bacterium]|nr:homoserine dehydrogenase [Phycisphaerae bacterium]